MAYLSHELLNHLKNVNSPTYWPNPKLLGIELFKDNNHKGGLFFFSALTSKGNVSLTRWDVPSLSQNNILQVFHTRLSDLFVNQAVIAPGHEHLIQTATWTCFKDKNGHIKQLLDVMPELVNIGEVFSWVSKPENERPPKNVMYHIISQFIDALQVRHASAHTPSLNLIQIRDLETDPNAIHTAGITWHSRGLNRVTRPITRILMSGQTIGRITHKMNIHTKQLEPAIILTGFGPIVTDRPALGEVAQMTSATGINSVPKLLGHHTNHYILKHWKNPNAIMKADCFKTQGFIDAVVSFIHRFENNKKPKFTQQLKQGLLRGIGVSMEAVLQQSRMPGIAVAELTICEPSHCLLGGVLADITRFMMDLIIDKDESNIRAQIVSKMWDEMQQFCKNSYEDNVRFDSIRTSKVGWKFIYNYIGALRLDACLQCFTCAENEQLQLLIIAFEKLLIMIALIFGPFWNSDVRYLCCQLYKDMLRAFHNSTIDKPVRNWSEDSSSSKTKTRTPQFNVEEFHKYCQTHSNDKDPFTVDNLPQWRKRFNQAKKQEYAEKQRQKVEKQHRDRKIVKQDLPHARSAIDTPNIEYAHQFLEVDLYEMGSGHLCNSMILESSLGCVCLCVCLCLFVD